jgi:HlyD family secretion protein
MTTGAGPKTRESSGGSVPPKELDVSRGSDEPFSAVVALERELAAGRRRRILTVVAGVLVVAVILLAFRFYQKRQAPAPTSPFVTAPVEVRDLVESIESSGKLRPLIEVKVGAQVSGRVVSVHADFNQTVKKGDLLAEIDPSLFGAQVSQVNGQLGTAKAQLDRARAAEGAARTVFERQQRLHHEGLSPRAAVDDAEAALRVASAEAAAADAAIRGLRAQLASANTTLEYTKIHSPIDGVVIDRAVDPGQTVASSFAAPVLFVIARDLSEMQVLADIDEADVGKVRHGMLASVRVDAFPEQSFAGTVTQIRYNPTEVQGIVTYAAVVDVSNAELKLRPGMTVTVTITAQKVQKVPAVRNAALRFRPRNAKSADASQPLAPGKRRIYVVDSKPAGDPAAKAASEAVEPTTHPKETLKPLIVGIGISDGVWTELKDHAIAAGAQVVTEERASEEGRQKFLGVF